MGHKDHYATLGVPRDAELSLIQATYWRLARECSGALTSDPEAPRLLRDLNAAYEVLSTPELRRQYDEALPPPGLRAEGVSRSRRRIGGWWRRFRGNEKKVEAKKDVLRPEPPPETEQLEMSPAGQVSSGTLPHPEAAREETIAVPEVLTESKTGPEDSSPVRWEMPALQAFAASVGVTVLGGVALAAGADPAMTLVLAGMALFFCLFPWRFGRLPERLVPRAQDQHPPDEGQRAAALRDSTAAIVARWRQTVALSDGRSWPPTDSGASQPPAPQRQVDL